MHRPGVDYWATSRPSTQLPQPAQIPSRTSVSSSGPPSLSRTSTADLRSQYEDAPHTRTASGLGQREPTVPPSPSLSDSATSSTAAASATGSSKERETFVVKLAELEDTKKQVIQLQQQQLQEEVRVGRMQAAWARKVLEHANELSTLKASLKREETLRMVAEQERQDAINESQQLRAALRALLVQPNYHNGTANTSTVPLTLYEEARRLLLRCERTLTELKMLQLKATNADGMERLRRYDVPVLDGIPPAWPPEVSANNTKQEGNSDADLLTPRSTTALATATAAGPSPVEETPTGPEVSALTTVSSNTSSSPTSPDHPTITSHDLGSSQNNTTQGDAKADETQPAVPAVAPAKASQNASPNTTKRGARRVLLSPPILSPSPDEGDAQTAEVSSHDDLRATADWSGPMHKFTPNKAKQNVSLEPSTVATIETQPKTAAAASALTTPSSSRLHPQPGALLSEFEREDIIRDTDQLIHQLSRETVVLANSQGIHNSSDVAALCRRRGLDYIDPAFLPVTETLGLASGGCCVYDPDEGSSYLVQWSTRDTFLPHGQRPQLLTSAGVGPNALRCGRLGDTGVVAALAALAEATGAVTSVLASTTREEERNGLYVVWLCVRGWWTRVTVDAYLPCLCESDQTVDFYGCSNVATNDLWAPMCEKALAKIYGNYEALHHLSADIVLGHLTGGPVECWDWWRCNSDTALNEIEAAINTSARGAGIVLLTTHSAAALQGSTPQPGMANARSEYEYLGLLPGTSYRVLAVAENADGEALILLRNWAKASSSSSRHNGTARVKNNGWDCRDVSPLREGESVKASTLIDAPKKLHNAAAQYGGSNRKEEDEDGCVWLSYTKQILPLFDKCHACFDCRRFHDARFPIRFSGSTPAVPAQLIRVRVQDRRSRNTHGVAPRPTRLWIGLHQPGFNGKGTDTPVPWALKVTLIGQEEVSSLYSDRGRHRSNYGASGVSAAASPPPYTRPAHRSYILSESFMGEPQPLPAVWMYLELDSENFAVNTLDSDDEDDAASMELFIVPQMELLGSIAKHSLENTVMNGSVGSGGDRQNGIRSKSLRHNHLQEYADEDNEDQFDDETGSVWSRCDPLSSATTNNNTELSFGACTTAVVAVLAEEKDSVAVDVVEAPAELRAAIYHDVVDRIDFSECVPPVLPRRANRHSLPVAQNNKNGASAAASSTGMDVRCQVNGRCLSTFSW